MKYHCDDKVERRAIRIRCFIHKWRNIEKALGDAKHKASGLFWALRNAKDLAEAKSISDQLESVLKTQNQSSLQSYLEAKQDLMIVHQLKLSRELKAFFSSTNPIESLNSLFEEDMRPGKMLEKLNSFSTLACHLLSGFRNENTTGPGLSNTCRFMEFTS